MPLWRGIHAGMDPHDRSVAPHRRLNWRNLLEEADRRQWVDLPREDEVRTITTRYHLIYISSLIFNFTLLQTCLTNKITNLSISYSITMFIYPFSMFSYFIDEFFFVFIITVYIFL